MARRDNQGIQIAMIVFILTTLLFMVTTYFGYSSSTALKGEVEKAAVRSQRRPGPTRSGNHVVDQYSRLHGRSQHGSSRRRNRSEAFA